MTFFYIIGASLLISLLSLLGIVLTGNKTWHTISKYHKTILAFISGIFLLSSLGLYEEAVHLGSPLIAGISLLIGLILVYGIELIWPESHHHHQTDCHDCQNKINPKNRRIIIGDAIHNFTDGLILATAFMVSPAFGVFAFISIASHEIIQELSEYIFLRQTGLSKAKALKLNFWSAISIVPGAIIGFWFGNLPELQPYLLGISAGAFLFIVFHDLLPEVFHSKKNIIDLVALVSGGLVIILLGIAFPHTHDDHSDNQSHDHEEIHLLEQKTFDTENPEMILETHNHEHHHD